jgi:LCP family protein required for cell wall assembly
MRPRHSSQAEPGPSAPGDARDGRDAPRTPTSHRGGGHRGSGTGVGAGTGTAPGPGRAAARKARRGRRSRVLKILALSIAGIVLLAGAGVGYLYYHLSGNVRTAPLYNGKDKASAVGVEKADASGHTPINVLLLGSDTRGSKKDCKYGGACKTAAGARADVEMVVHLSADRSNMTVMSIPRDLYTQLPPCTDPVTHASTPGGFNQINSTLQYGPGCTATAVHKLTGIPIDNFAMVDFSGVVTMSDALGGVDLCFDHSFYDINSGLKLSQGHHTIKGKAALQFLRTRDSFGDGSDNVGRTTATHVFFTAMITKLKKAGTVTNLPAMYKIANAATKALTVSDGLKTPLDMIHLAQNLNKVPSNRITFTTMQNVTDPDPGMHSHVIQGPGASTLFKAIADDQSLTDAKGKAAGVAKKQTVKPADIHVDVRNGSGVQAPRAGDVLGGLTAQGFGAGTTGNAPATAPTSSLTYGPGQAAAAKLTARVLGLPAKDVKAGTTAGLTLVVGADWPSGTTFPGSKPSKAPVDTGQALSNAHQQNGGKVPCVKVSTQYTENKLVLPTSTPSSPGETPEEMYAIYSNRPDSAK